MSVGIYFFELIKGFLIVYDLKLFDKSVQCIQRQNQYLNCSFFIAHEIIPKFYEV